MEDQQLKEAIEKVLSENRSKFGLGASGDARPADTDVFFAILPSVLGACITKHTDSPTALAMTFLMARETVGQCCMMGVARVATVCTDGSHLAIMPQRPNVPGVAPPVTAGRDPTSGGVVVAQYPTQGGGGTQIVGMQQPGPGGMVAQYPTNSGAGGGVVQHGGGPMGQPAGNGWKGVMVAMHPNDPNVHPIAQPQLPPQQPQFPQQQGQR